MARLSPIIVFPGAGGGVDGAMFRTNMGDVLRVEPINYPGWTRYVEEGFSADALIADLSRQITKKVPTGPIHIVGSSIGGHLGYAAAVSLQSHGREIGGFCALDSF